MVEHTLICKRKQELVKELLERGRLKTEGKEDRFSEPKRRKGVHTWRGITPQRQRQCVVYWLPESV